MNRAIRPWLLAVACLFGAALIPSWLAAPALGFGGGLLRGRPGSGWRVGLLVAGGWGLRLAMYAAGGTLFPTADLLGRVLQVGATGVLVATIVFGFLLAASAGHIGAALGSRWRPERVTA